MELNRKIEDIQISCVMDSSNLAEIVLSALEELHLSLEKLSAGEKKLCRQNEQLIEAHEVIKHCEEHYRALVQASCQVIWTADENGCSPDAAAWVDAFTGLTKDN